MKLNLSDLYNSFKFLLEECEAYGLSEIEITDDFYWSMGIDEMFDFQTQPSPPTTVGSLCDDYEWIKRMLSEDTATSLDFERLAHLLLAVAKTIQTPGEPLTGNLDSEEVSASLTETVCSTIYPIYVSRTYPEMEQETVVYSIGYSADDLIAKFGINSTNHKPYKIDIEENIGEEAYEIVLKHLREIVMSQPENVQNSWERYPHKFIIDENGIRDITL